MYANREGLDLHTYVDLVILTFIGGFIKSHVKARSDKVIKFDFTTVQDLCRQYLLEELAVVAMWRDKILPPLDLPSALLSEDVTFSLVYPFGHNSTNKDVFNCFGQLCSEKLILLNLHKNTKQKKPSERTVAHLESVRVSAMEKPVAELGGCQEEELHILVPHTIANDGISYLQGGKPSPRAERTNPDVAPLFISAPSVKGRKIDRLETDEPLNSLSLDETTTVIPVDSLEAVSPQKDVTLPLLRVRPIPKSTSDSSLCLTKSPWEERSGSPVMFARGSSDEKSRLPETSPRKGAESPF